MVLYLMPTTIILQQILLSLPPPSLALPRVNFHSGGGVIGAVNKEAQNKGVSYEGEDKKKRKNKKKNSDVLDGSYP
jgi:hypothetical protein